MNKRLYTKGGRMRAAWLAAAAIATLPLTAAGDVRADDFSWSGIYVGGMGGYNWNKDLTTEYITATGAARNISFAYEPEGFSGGIKAGVNFEAGSFVYGAEADFELTNIKGTFIDRIENIGRGDDEYDWQASIRARMGLAVDRFMVYGTGGFAMSKIQNTYTLVIPPPVSEVFSDVKHGWTIGGGVDFAVTDSLIAGVEYRYTKYDLFSNVSTVAFPGLTGTQEPTSSAIRFSLSYKF